MEQVVVERDFLCSLNPIFRLNDVKILWYNNVFKVGQTNSLQQRLLVISTTGIFLIRKKSFAFQSRVINSISFCDLVSLYVAGKCASFSSKQTQIRVKHPDITDVAFLTFFIRQTQFPTDVLPLNITFSDEKMANKIMPAQSPYQPKSLFLDRMLSCVMHFNIMVTNTLLASYFPSSASRVFTITKELIESPLFQAWILSLAYEQDVETLKLYRFQISRLLTQSSHLIRYNRFIQTLHLNEMEFDDSGPLLLQLFSKAHGFKPVKWIFENCDLSKPSFNQFFDAIGQIGKQITHIQFIKCNFSEASFPALFQSIFFNECFHSLQNFVIDHSSAHNILIHVTEILCCSWALEQKCFHQLSITKSCSEDCSHFLTQLLKFDVGIQHVNLCENNFLAPIFFPAGENISPREITFLGLRNCQMSIEFLLSLINLIKDSKLFVHGLDLSELSLNGDDFTQLLTSISDLVIPGLKTLLFDKNRMNSNQTLLFTNFLKLQPSLRNLSINCSIDIRESPNGLLSFINYAAKQPIVTLSMQGDQSMELSFGRLLIPLLQGLKNAQNLDITDQRVGQEGLDSLLPIIINGQLIELRFDGSNVKSFDFLCQFCSTLLSSQRITFASFPYKDFDLRVNELALSSSDDNFESSIQTLRQSFESRFKHPRRSLSFLKNISLTHSVTKISTEKKLINPFKRLTRTNSFNLMPNDNNNSLMMKPEIEKLYRECVGDDAGNDPIVILMTTIENSITYDNLLSDIRKSNMP